MVGDSFIARLHGISYHEDIPNCLCDVCLERKTNMVDNQHRKISGYRDLSEQEIAILNEIKELERKVLEVHSQVVQIPDVNPRSAAIAKTELQTGFMWLARAVARPNGE